MPEKSKKEERKNSKQNKIKQNNHHKKAGTLQLRALEKKVKNHGVGDVPRGTEDKIIVNSLEHPFRLRKPKKKCYDFFSSRQIVHLIKNNHIGTLHQRL